MDDAQPDDCTDERSDSNRLEMRGEPRRPHSFASGLPAYNPHVPASVEFRHVSVEPILHDIDLRIASGEAVAFIGRSGAGKTTTLRLVNGLVRPTSGEVLVDGSSLATADLIGLDTLKLIAESMFEEYGEARFKAPTLLRRLVSLGHLGRKTGRGFFRYN